LRREAVNDDIVIEKKGGDITGDELRAASDAHSLSRRDGREHAAPVERRDQLTSAPTP